MGSQTHFDYLITDKSRLLLCHIGGTSGRWGAGGAGEAGGDEEVNSKLYFPDCPLPIAHSRLPIVCSLFPVPCSLFPVPYSLFPVPCFLTKDK
ncbi:MAG: hypothetical protein RIE73_20700 [Coleofasciculus sp. C1-SOL-03]